MAKKENWHGDKCREGIEGGVAGSDWPVHGPHAQGRCSDFLGAYCREESHLNKISRFQNLLTKSGRGIISTRSGFLGAGLGDLNTGC